MRDTAPGWLTTVAEQYSARGAVDDALVRAATAVEVGVVSVSADGGVWWSDEAYRLHGRPRWRRVRLLDDVTLGVDPASAVDLLQAYAATLTDPDTDLRYTVTGAQGERRELVLRAIGEGVALVHRAGREARPASVVDVRDGRRGPAAPPATPARASEAARTGRPTPEPAAGRPTAAEPAVEPTVAEPTAVEPTVAEPSGEVAPEPVAPDADGTAAGEPAVAEGEPDAADLDLAAAVLSATPDLVLLYDVAAQQLVSMAGNDDDARALIERLRHGGHLSDDVHPDDVATLAAWRDALGSLEPDEVRHVDVRLRHPDGWRWTEVRGSEFRRDADDRATEVVLIVRDVHERVSAAHRVAASERAFRELFASSPVGLAVLDESGRFTDVNDAFCGLVGRPRDAVLATVFEALLHPEDRAAAVISRARRVTEGATTSSAERRLTKADGSTIWVRLRTTDLDTDDEPRTLVSLEDVTAAKDTEARLRHDALHDELTGLPNRRLITDRLELALTRARRARSRVAVFFIDLDDLKRVNDTHPWQHRAGDLLITSVASRLRETLREADTLGRLGGDEFVAVCEDVGDDDAIREIGDRLLAAVCRPLSIGTETVPVGVSVGVAVTDDDDEAAEHLLRRADAAMYMAKAAGGSRVSRADAGPIDVPQHLDLVGALARRELRLHYQPVVSLGSGAVLGLSAALRWDDPDRGLVPAHELRSALGAGASALPVVHWAIDTAVTDVRTVAPTRAEHVSIWLSVPGRAALAASTRDAIAAAIAGADGSRTADTAPSLVLDVHEVDVASLTRRQALHRHLDDLLEVGPLALGVEHFTADLVPVGMLQLLSAASVTFDPDLLGSAGENHATEELVRALVSAASALGVITIAADVDSPEQLALARSLGIHAAFGDIAGPAAPMDTYADLLHGGRCELPGAEPAPARDVVDDVAAGSAARSAAGSAARPAPGTELRPGPDEGPSDEDIWAALFDVRRTSAPDEPTAPAAGEEPHDEPVVALEPYPDIPPEPRAPHDADAPLPPAPPLWPTAEAEPAPLAEAGSAPAAEAVALSELPPVADLDDDVAPGTPDQPEAPEAPEAVEQQEQPGPVDRAGPVPLLEIDLREGSVRVAGTDEPVTPPAAPASGGPIGDSLARELGIDVGPVDRPSIADDVARELGVWLPPPRSLAEQVARELDIELPDDE
ncbi:MAG: diguanylate cyclase [Frankiales bacterium]|nr:diguanylate cyclase [Frankiales bacterium]